MKSKELSTCFCTPEVAKCKAFYERHFAARVIFDCGWYVNLRIDGDGNSIQFMEPKGGMPEFGEIGRAHV